MPAVRLFLVVLALLLAGCAERGKITVAEPVPGITVHRIFVATGRAPVPGRDRFGGSRADALHFAHFDVSVPPAHETGRIEWPDLAPDPFRHFMTVGEARHDAAGFAREIDAALARRDAAAQDVMVFVHGFNNTFAEGLYRQVQMTHDFAVPGVVVNYSWPSLGSPLGYVHDRDSALVARDGLQQVLEQVAQTRAQRIVLVAHSMGGFLTMETLRQMGRDGRGPVWDKISPVVMLAPDVDLDVFKAQARATGGLPQPFIVFASARDRALMLSSRLSGQEVRLGSVGTVNDLEGLGVTVIDTTELGDGDRYNHLTAVTSPAAIAVLSNLGGYQAALNADQVPEGVLPGTVNLVRNATRLVLSPLGLLLPPVE